MAVSSPQTLALSMGLALLVVWRVYKRIRRLVGRQRLHRVRPWLTVTLFPLLILLLMAVSMAHPLTAAGLLGGVLAGAGLGLYGLRLTRFEATPEGLFYTPNAHLGIALSLLFIGRLAFRAAHLFLLGETLQGGLRGEPPDAFMRSPWTLLIFGLLAGYYVCYAVGLLRWRARVARGA